MFRVFLGLIFMILTVNNNYASELIKHEFHQQTYFVYQPKDLSKLQLGLKDTQGKYLNSFIAWQKDIKPCEQLTFAMNAGMFHANYSPVGLYIEHGKVLYPLNQDQGFGNFFLKPNGVLAWNSKGAFLNTTNQWVKNKNKVDYATQSGPMLVVNGKIHPQFLKNSNSKTIRNGVGIKDGKLFFVISAGQVNFYQFAEFFQNQLHVEHALYLDGSISNIFMSNRIKQNQASWFGPMLGYVDKKCD